VTNAHNTGAQYNPSVTDGQNKMMNPWLSHVSELNTEQKDMKASQVKCRLRKTDCLEQKIKESIEKDNVEVDEQLSDGLYETVKEHSKSEI